MTPDPSRYPPRHQFCRLRLAVVDAAPLRLGREVVSFPEGIAKGLIRLAAHALTRVVISFLIAAKTVSDMYIFPRGFSEPGTRDTHVDTGKVRL